MSQILQKCSVLSEDKFDVLKQPTYSTSFVQPAHSFLNPSGTQQPSAHSEHIKELLNSWSASSLAQQKNGGMQVFKLPSVKEVQPKMDECVDLNYQLG